MRNQRAIYTDEQTKYLEREFLSQQNPPLSQIKNLALTLGLTESRVKIWFQNRRAKFRKEFKERLDQPVQQQIVPSFVQQEMQLQAFPQQSALATVISQMAVKEDSNNNIQPKLGNSSTRRPLTDVTNRYN